MLVQAWPSLLALTLAGSTLATPLIAEPIFNRDLEIRQTDTSKCDPNGYRSQNGMNFTNYCGQNNPFNDAQRPFTSPSMVDCMEHCSRYWGDGEGCFGIVWIESNGECWIRNSTTGTKNLIQKDGHYSALTVQGNMDGFDTACPGEDKSVKDLAGVEGFKYTLNCGKVIGGFDSCFLGYPQPCLASPYAGFYHTKTLEECLRICVDQHPLCKAVSWSPDLKIGFANCWPKTGFPETLTTPGTKQGILHSATITQIDRIDSICPSSKSYKAQGNKNFELHCGQVNTGTNITSIHTQNITACMDNCARSDQKCIGIVFDSSLSGGYKNCYLQNTTNTVNDQPSATYAVLAGSSTPSGGSSLGGGTNGSSDSSSSNSSKAWIAGPVIGGIAAIGIIAFAIFWWRRRKAANANSTPPAEKDGREFGAYGPAPVYSPGGRPDPAHPQPYFDNTRINELGGNDRIANELPATTKYAHAHTAKQTPPTELP